MKRTLAAVVLLTALGIFFKLALKENQAPRASDPALAVQTPDQAPRRVDQEAALRAKYPAQSALVDRVLERYRHTALEIEQTDGLRGLTLLDAMDLEAVFLYERHPQEFRKLAETLDDRAAADLLVHWSSYFGLKRADDVDREVLIAEIARLAPSRRRVAGRHPEALPLILADPAGVVDLIDRLQDDPRALGDALAVLDFIRLDDGTADLRQALRTLEHHRTLAIDAFRQMGPEGFALVTLYGPVLEALGGALPLDEALIVLRVNTDDVDSLLQTRSPEAVASALRHVASAGVVEAAGSSPHALRLSMEFGDEGDQALRRAGGDAADVVYEEYSDPLLRTQAVASLAQYGPMAAAMLAKYASDSDFREILRRHGPAIIPPVARSDVAPETLLMLQQKARRSLSESLAQEVLTLSGESGQATIRLIREEGLGRVQALNDSEVKFYQFLPLYDLVHLTGVVGQGHAPTRGEMAWALLDGCFVVADVLSLSALQPEGAAASEVIRAEVKASTREAVRSGTREVVEEVVESTAPALGRQGAETALEAGGRLSRWWAVRAAGGTFELLRRLPEALPRMSLEQVSSMAAPLCRKAGSASEHLGAGPAPEGWPAASAPDSLRPVDQVRRRQRGTGRSGRRGDPQDGRTSAQPTTRRRCLAVNGAHSGFPNRPALLLAFPVGNRNAICVNLGNIRTFGGRFYVVRSIHRARSRRGR